MEKDTDRSELCLLLTNTASSCDTVDRILTLLQNSPNEAQKVDNETGMLPIHLACRQKSSHEIIKSLLQSYPAAIHIRDHAKRLPLHHVFGMSSKVKSKVEGSTELKRSKLLCSETIAEISAPVVELLATTSPKSVTEEDSCGDSPFDLFTDLCSGQSGYIDDIEKSKMILSILVTSIISVVDEDLEKDSQYSLQVDKLINDFLFLPLYLLDEALRFKRIQEIFNKVMSRPHYCAKLFIDLWVHFFMILSFSHITVITQNNALDGKKDGVFHVNSLTYLEFIYFGSCYFALVDALEITRHVQMDTFDIWMKNSWNWYSVLNVILALLSALLMHYDPEDFGKYSYLIMVAGVFQWLGILRNIRIMSVQFTVFLKSTSTVLYKMIPFLLATFLLLGSFAFLYHVGSYDFAECTTFRNDGGNWNMEDLSYCEFESSFLKAYTLFVGGGIEVDEFDDTFTLAVISSLFGFVIIILQLNVLIAIVSDGYAEVNSMGVTIFLRRRFEFIAQMRSLIYTVERTTIKFSAVQSFFTRVDLTMKRQWDQAMVSISRRNSLRNPTAKYSDDYSGSLLYKIGLIFLIPLWLLIGLATCGILWPPQVRRWLICPLVCIEVEEDTNSEQIKDLSSKMDALEKRCEELCVQFSKSTSTEQSKIDDLHAKCDKLQAMLSTLISGLEMESS